MRQSIFLYIRLSSKPINHPTMNDRKKVLEYLQSHDIAYECLEHPATPTVEEAMKYWKNAPGVQHCKNLFLRNHKGNRHYLVIIPWSKKLDTHRLEKIIGESRLSFASEKRMEHFLGVKPGSVSLFGLINDENNEVNLILDQDLESASGISFHPNDNTASLIISHEGFMKFIENCGNSYKFLNLD